MGVTQNASSALAPTKYQEIMLIEGNTIIAPSNPLNPRLFYAQIGSLASLVGGNDNYTTQELQDAVGGKKSLLYCLIKNESSWRTDIYGDKGRAYGLLQFHRPTFERYSEKYGLVLDYYSPIDQIILAELMINENFNNITHWSVYKLCI